MSDPNKRKYKKLYAEEFNMAQSILADEDGHLEWSPHDYEAFTFKGPQISLVFYPHRTTARHYHIRVRDQNSKNAMRAEEIMCKLDTLSGFNCTFSRNRPLAKVLEGLRHD